MSSMPSDDHNALAQLALLVGSHAVLAEEPTWLTELCVAPDRCSDCYLPAMPENNMAVMYKANPYVGWYKCPKGT